jgi:hypothetical protein
MNIGASENDIRSNHANFGVGIDADKRSEQKGQSSFASAVET